TRPLAPGWRVFFPEPHVFGTSSKSVLGFITRCRCATGNSSGPCRDLEENMLRHFLKFTALGRMVVIPIRLYGALLYPLRQMGSILRWGFSSKEHYNHTYHLTPLSRAYLVSYTAVVSGHSEEEIEKYFVELELDDELRRSLMEQARASPDRHNSDIEPRYGRRLGWYALMRATKPRVVVETGVDRGLGTAVIAAALR